MFHVSNVMLKFIICCEFGTIWHQRNTCRAITGRFCGALLGAVCSSENVMYVIFTDDAHGVASDDTAVSCTQMTLGDFLVFVLSSAINCRSHSVLWLSVHACICLSVIVY